MPTKKVTVEMSEDMLAALACLADKEGVTPTEVLIKAVALKGFVDRLYDKGERLLLEKADGTVTEIVVR